MFVISFTFTHILLMNGEKLMLSGGPSYGINSLGSERRDKLSQTIQDLGYEASLVDPYLSLIPDTRKMILRNINMV